ncbi:MAG: hypothetical protein COT61_02365 [Candidatus Portnoybacteria bacterium CG09_land_8_20_14_0_10_44_13]|uniref:Uncharacterized protein n=2 Tax=Candidatus Portnoyibacteriota TaxID=1817913 RepID=A0A2H0WVV0_9BACT|nr:MAG: hypothetical protein COT61_02365 [Candidatus Portnoybacteria bacterium CG09_land_8_20_14_0_10_44_13]PIZ69393.1 MAG: hypothetical protein COY11_04550 [Candidatus Portnoybacteria bacterium CG_4_10_14_0_2_um_filter_44_20]
MSFLYFSKTKTLREGRIFVRQIFAILFNHWPELSSTGPEEGMVSVGVVVPVVFFGKEARRLSIAVCKAVCRDH